jgi:hypothetical protein
VRQGHPASARIQRLACHTLAMRKVFATVALLLLAPLPAMARGVSPYLPLNLDPRIEHQIERVLILADKPVLTRPIAAATVLDALPRACKRDAALCQEVRRYLERYMSRAAITHASVEGYASDGNSDRTVPNAYGRRVDSSWAVSAAGFWQPTDHVLLSLGGVAYEGETNPQGSVLSLGFDRAQLDIGYRGHWLSPMTDSSMLLSTQAPTMPSITLSNYVPLTRFGFHYELFLAEMSTSDHIVFENRYTSGHPRLGGLHLSIEPATGWSLGANRLLQFGGGERNASVQDAFKAFFSPSTYDNAHAGSDPNAEFGNQVASLTSSFIFPGRVPFSVYFEYAGEDTSNGKNFLLGNSSISAGINFPRLWERFDLTFETTDWQNGWYTHHIYQDGLVNDGHVIGNWFGDERITGDQIGGTSNMVRLGWYPQFGGIFEARIRTMQNASYSTFSYSRERELTVGYSRPVGALVVGGEASGGRDVFGERFTQVGVFARLGDRRSGGMMPESEDSPEDGAEIFATAGVSASKVRIDLDYTLPVTTTGISLAPHVAVGARRAVSDRSDLGARLELTRVDEHTLIAARLIDYRYRTHGPLAISAFLGAARYDLATSAQGLYAGLGLEWRDIAPGWNLGMDVNCAFKVARDDLVANDPIGGREDSFYDIFGATLSLTRRF